MIAFDFEYYKPSSIAEAVETYSIVQTQGKSAMFFSGGTEFITFARVNKLKADAVIDIKGIPECNVLEVQGNELVIGATMSLNKITESKLFPLLGECVKQIADHTSRNKITIGGNINSELIYRESVLPLLLTNAKVKITNGNEVETVSLDTVFNKEMKLKPGNFLLQLMVDTSYIDLPYVSLKRTKISKVGYPVVSVAAITKNNQIQVAFSGVCEYPFRSAKIEAILNDSNGTTDERIERVIAHLPSSIVDDIQGSGEYRAFVLKNVLLDTLNVLERVK
ncbi:FAD binding domain-containing protein [Sporosarcina sp. G11-34]|uniref:FAD binding domain-containing protein n=1 Tax=Sporosarcina sp. G11-34 TaxID=2849605 RepID=UPI0022A95CC1|nr:FAD binding domain-containing protein [Sporosarcina sp. G11-34]MCZ2258130.1 FAD binding domain-containing protein [Sporosarcina sp. G11-34]